MSNIPLCEWKKKSGFKYSEWSEANIYTTMLKHYGLSLGQLLLFILSQFPGVSCRLDGLLL